GAVGYFLLTGRLAFPAARMAELPLLWGRPLPAPSVLAPEVPRALDSLIASLLGMNPFARPQNAAEVFDRLTALADLPASEAPEVAQAYLVSPAFVGRSRALRRFERSLLRAARGRGAALLLEGHAGVGRSRLLSHLLREAKVKGFATLRVNARDGSQNPLRIARELARGLREAEPALLQTLAGEVAHFADLKIDQSPDAAGSASLDARVVPELVQAYEDLFTRAATRSKLVIGVDDLPDCDDVSASLLARLSAAARTHRLLVVATALSESNSALVERYRKGARVLHVAPLIAAETRGLLSSVFGDVHHLDSVAEWTERLSRGNPRTALELAQQLVDQGVAVFESGSWRLPNSLDGTKLPESVDQALDARVQALSRAARDLAEALALTSDHDPLEVSEYPGLGDAADSTEVFSSLSELTAADVLRPAGNSHLFSHQQMKDAVRRSIAPGDFTRLHRLLARAYGSKVLSAYHHFRGGEQAEAFAKVVTVRVSGSAPSGRGASFLRSPEGIRLYEDLFEWAAARPVPARQFAALARIILRLAAVADERLARHAPRIIERLQTDSGLIFWQELASVADPLERIRACVSKAYARYESTPQSERAMDPGRAIHELAIAAISLAGAYAIHGDTRAIAGITELMAPLRPLSPGLDVVCDVIAYTARATRGQNALELKRHVLEQVSLPVFGIDEVARTALELLTRYYIALEEISSGLVPDVERLRPLEAHPSFAALLWQLRMLSSLLSGEQSAAAALRRKRDLAITGGVPVERHLETSAHYETLAHVVLGDLQALRHMLAPLKERGERYPHWKVQHSLALGACHALRSDLHRAIQTYQAGLRLIGSELDHPCWAELVTQLARTQSEFGQPDQALQLASAALPRARELSLPAIHVHRIEMALALAQAQLGEGRAALERASAVVSRAEAEDIRGVFLIDLYTSRARVAARAGDEAGFDAAALIARSACANLESEPFAAKQIAALDALATVGPFTQRAGYSAAMDRTATTLCERIEDELGRCVTRDELVRRSLQLILEQCPAEQAFLYLVFERTLRLELALPEALPPAELDERVREIHAGLGHADERTLTLASSVNPSTADPDFELIPLGFDGDGIWSVVGIAALSRARKPRAVSSHTLLVIARGLARFTERSVRASHGGS
ncbi:MAG TPA: AAA family ATPase, partial [Polyangiaceae bacterium]|nr:AAA family ATPase [Polyangiaceae bacterium]